MPKNILVILVLLSTVACADTSTTARDERLSAQIELRPCIKTTRDMPCKVSIYRLLASPEKFSKSAVSLQGFLSRGPRGSLLLFPSRESSEFSLRNEGVAVAAQTVPKALAAGPIDQYVRVIGVFKQGNEGAANMLDGVEDTIGLIEDAEVRLDIGDAWSCPNVHASERGSHFLRPGACEFQNKIEAAAPAPVLQN